MLEAALRSKIEREPLPEKFQRRALLWMYRGHRKTPDSWVSRIISALLDIGRVVCDSLKPIPEIIVVGPSMTIAVRSPQPNIDRRFG